LFWGCGVFLYKKTGARYSGKTFVFVYRPTTKNLLEKSSYDIRYVTPAINAAAVACAPVDWRNSGAWTPLQATINNGWVVPVFVGTKTRNICLFLRVQALALTDKKASVVPRLIVPLNAPRL
jgi:hypothetical protein